MQISVCQKIVEIINAETEMNRKVKDTLVPVLVSQWVSNQHWKFEWELYHLRTQSCLGWIGVFKGHLETVKSLLNKLMTYV